MELQEALNKVISSQGKDFILNPKVIYALLDYNAFEKHRALKNIFKTLHSEGIIARLFDIGDWNVDCEQLIYEVEQDFAFPKDLIVYILQNIAICLWGIKKSDKSIPTFDGEQFYQPNNEQINCSVELIPTNNPKVFIRKDWYEESSMEFQDMNISIKRNTIKGIEYDSIDITTDILYKDKSILPEYTEHHLFLNGINNKGQVVLRRPIITDLFDASLVYKNEVLPYKNCFIDFNALVNIPINKVISKYVINIEVGGYGRSSDSSTPVIENGVGKFYYISTLDDIIIDDIVDLGNLLHNEIETPSFIGLIGNISKKINGHSVLYLYMEFDKPINDSRSYLNCGNYSLRIYNKKGQLKDSHRLYVNENNKNNVKPHFSYYEIILTKLDITDIGRLEIIKDNRGI